MVVYVAMAILGVITYRILDSAMPFSITRSDALLGQDIHYKGPQPTIYKTVEFDGMRFKHFKTIKKCESGVENA